jgi:uncharacterized protein (DUF433 family)
MRSSLYSRTPILLLSSWHKIETRCLTGNRQHSRTINGLWRIPSLLGGKLAIRGTRLSVSLILECLASGMSLADIGETFDHVFPSEALPEVLKVASELTDSFHVAA